jgi:spore maturation protein CgeB
MQGAGDAEGLAPSLVRGLADADCELHSLRLDPPAATLMHRVACYLAPGYAFPEANARLKLQVNTLCPDVLWLFKAMEIYPETLRKLRQRQIMLVNYNADHPFRYFARGSGNNNVRRAIPYYHLHLTYSERIRREMLERYPGIQIGVVPFGHDVGDAVYGQISGEVETVRACFLGNPDQHRRENIERLLEAGVPVDVYGYRWDRFLKPSPLLRMHGQVVGDEMLRTLRRYRVQLNFFRPHNADSHNMRTFEVPACGGIMLAEDSFEHRAFFESGHEAFFFRTPKEMVEGARFLLDMPTSRADAVRRAARARSMSSRYAYRDRAHAALAAINEVAAARRRSDLRTRRECIASL